MEQRQIFCPEEKKLTKEKYSRLLAAAESKADKRLNLIIQTICRTGILVIEQRLITVEAVRKDEAVVSVRQENLYNVVCK